MYFHVLMGLAFLDSFIRCSQIFEIFHYNRQGQPIIFQPNDQWKLSFKLFLERMNGYVCIQYFL
jgi:hypothetical protein